MQLTIIAYISVDKIDLFRVKEEVTHPNISNKTTNGLVSTFYECEL